MAEQILECCKWIANAFVMSWNALGTWGLFGFCIIAPQIIIRVRNLVKKIFKF